MGFYESLDVLVGAGLLACAPAIGCVVPAGAVRAGGQFSVLLRARGLADPVGAVLDGMARDIWLAQETRGITQAMAEAHAVGLAEMLEVVRPDPGQVAAALARNDAVAGDAIAAAIVRQATSLGALAEAGLIEEIAEFILGVLLRHVLEDAALLPSLKAAFEDVPVGPAVAAGQPVQAEVAVAASTPAPPASAAPSTAPAVAIPALPTTTSPARLPASGRFTELAAWLRASASPAMPAPVAGDDGALETLKAEAAAALAAADLETAAGRLRSLRRQLIEARRRSESRLHQQILALARHQSEEAMATAGLAELAYARQDFAAASALFGEAAEGLATAEPATARRLLLRQADAHLRAAEPERAAGPLRQAAMIYAEVLRQARSAGDGSATGAADLGIGQVLLRQAEWGDRAEAIGEAAEAFRRASMALATDRASQAWAEARIGLGHALALAAERDPAANSGLSEAAAAYREGLEVLSAEAAPNDWAMTQVRLGAVLVRLAEQGTEPRSWLEAAAAMVRALDVFEQQGAVEQAALARRTLRQFHERWPLLSGRG